jgi:hypothetical protein
MRAEKKINYNRAILIKPRHLKDIYDVITRHSSDAPQVSVVCDDDLKLSPEILDDILEIPNNTQSRIRYIHFTTPGFKLPDISVWLGPIIPESNVTIDIKASGNKDDVVAIVSQIEQVVSDCFPWYASIATLVVLDWLAFLSGILGFVLVVLSIFNLLSNLSIHHTYFYGIQLMTFTFPIGLLLLVTPPLLRFMFPKYMFLIGDGIRQEATYDNRRKVIIHVIVFGLLISIVGGIIVSLVLKVFMQH